MILADVTLLVYASNEASTLHAPAREWWEDLMSRQVPVALAMEHRAEIHSNDRDFGRFPDLRLRNPLE